MNQYLCRLLLLILFVSESLFSQSDQSGFSILNWLNSRENISAVKVNPAGTYKDVFEVTIELPLDHFSLNSKTFPFRFYIAHKGVNNPLVFHTYGYGVKKMRIYELTEILDANQILLPFRFNQNARPDSIEWQYCTIKQGAYDYHRIREILKDIYKGPWVSMGVSKGGTDAVAYRSFFPDDVEATVAYSAPFPSSENDERINNYLFEQLGERAEREKLKNFQKILLKRKGEILPKITAKIKSYGISCRLDPEDIFYFSVFEFPFSLRQWKTVNISDIPHDKSSTGEVFDYLCKVIPMYAFLDPAVEAFKVTTYQMATEIGGYQFATNHLEEFINNTRRLPSTKLMGPQGVEMNYNPSAMKQLRKWVSEKGNNIIYLYGEFDPWTSAAPEDVTATNSAVIIEQSADHNVSILGSGKRDFIHSLLSSWLKIEVPFH